MTTGGLSPKIAITMARLKLRQGTYAGAVALLDSAIAIYGAANNTQKEFDALLQKMGEPCDPPRN